MLGPASDTLENVCEQLLERYAAETPAPDRAPISVDALVLDAKILLVCEHLQHCDIGESRLVDLSTSTDTLIEIIRARLFDRQAYAIRLDKLRSTFRQLGQSDRDRRAQKSAPMTDLGQNPP